MRGGDIEQWLVRLVVIQLTRARLPVSPDRGVCFCRLSPAAYPLAHVVHPVHPVTLASQQLQASSCVIASKPRDVAAPCGPSALSVDSAPDPALRRVLPSLSHVPPRAAVLAVRLPRISRWQGGLRLGEAHGHHLPHLLPPAPLVHLLPPLLPLPAAQLPQLCAARSPPAVRARSAAAELADADAAGALYACQGDGARDDCEQRRVVRAVGAGRLAGVGRAGQPPVGARTAPHPRGRLSRPKREQQRGGGRCR